MHGRPTAAASMSSYLVHRATGSRSDKPRKSSTSCSLDLLVCHQGASRPSSCHATASRQSAPSCAHDMERAPRGGGGATPALSRGRSEAGFYKKPVSDGGFQSTRARRFGGLGRAGGRPSRVGRVPVLLQYPRQHRLFRMRAPLARVRDKRPRPGVLGADHTGEASAPLCSGSPRFSRRGMACSVAVTTPRMLATPCWVRARPRGYPLWARLADALTPRSRASARLNRGTPWHDRFRSSSSASHHVRSASPLGMPAGEGYQ